MAVGPAVAGIGFDLTGNPASPVLIGAAFFAAGALSFVLFRLTETQSVPRAAT